MWTGFGVNSTKIVLMKMAVTTGVPIEFEVAVPDHERLKALFF